MRPHRAQPHVVVTDTRRALVIALLAVLDTVTPADAVTKRSYGWIPARCPARLRGR